MASRNPSTALLIPALLAVLLLPACQSNRPSTPSLESPLAIPDSWSAPSSGEALSVSWIQSFASPSLNALIVEAEANNFGLEAASQRTRAAAAAARITNSLRLPSLNAGLRSSRSKSLVNLDPPIPNTAETHALNLSARWEIDLWNRLGNQAASARAQQQASAFDLEALRLSLASQVAKAWFAATEARLQHELATASAESYEKNLETLERRYARGLVDAFDLRLTRSQAAASRAAAISRRNQMDTAIRSLEILLGRYPSGAIESDASLPPLASPPPAGIPSELLERRPDLLAQKSRVLSALSLAKAANKNWLPSLALTASDGTLSPNFSELLNDNFNVWSLAGDLSVALFQSGRLAAEREQLDAQQLAQIATFRDTALRAFREVESALQAETDLANLETQTRIAADESIAASDQVWNLYERGLVDITSALDAQRRAYDARSQLLSIHNRRLQNRIDLHIALGGDFEN